MNTFEVRTFRDGRWTTESRCSSSDEALTVANTLAGGRKFDGVKVVEEAYDEDQGLFRDKTVFSYFKQDEKVFNPRLKKREDARAAPIPALAKPRRTERRGVDARAWLLIFTLLFSLGGNVGLAFYWNGADGVTASAAKVGTASNRDNLVIYDLPPVTTNYKDGTGTRVLKIRLGLELSGSKEVRSVQERLTSIINSVANDLSELNESDLNSAQNLNKLRQSLHEGVQDAAGGTPIEGVLFKEVIVF